MRSRDFNINREVRKYKRFQTIGNANPFCCLCGKWRWWCRYEWHHILGRKIERRLVVLLCLDCHNEATEMQKEFPPIPDYVDPEAAKLIHMLRGLAILFEIAREENLLAAQRLLGSPDLNASDRTERGS
jgi:hypothetical protein